MKQEWTSSVIDISFWYSPVVDYCSKYMLSFLLGPSLQEDYTFMPHLQWAWLWPVECE